VVVAVVMVEVVDLCSLARMREMNGSAYDSSARTACECNWSTRDSQSSGSWGNDELYV